MTKKALIISVIALLLLIFSSMFFWNKQKVSEIKTHTQNWGVYMKELTNGPVMVAIDMGYKNEAPLLDKLNLFILKIKIKNPQQNGFPNSDEFAALSNIEDEVDNFSEKSTDTVSVAKSYDSGYRNIFLYTNDSKLKERIDFILKPYDYEYTTSIKIDSNWGFYTDVLFPDELTLRQIKNAQLVRSMSQEGDDGSVPRKIEHWFYFNSSSQRERLKEELMKQGFAFEAENTISDNKGQPYQLLLSRIDKADIATINQLDMDLFLKAKEFGGEYDGYESVLVKKTAL